jgi:DNA invertase Pin-like site-specific DNA recombinase
MTPKSTSGKPSGTPPTRPRAYSYLRFSTPEQMRGDSFRRQSELAKRYAESRGLELDEKLTFKDLGKSAYRSKHAKSGELRAFLDAVESGVVKEGSYLLVESLDRISRDAILAAQGLFLQIIQSGIRLVTLIDNREYSEESVTANPVELIISLLTMMRAHEESATKSRRLKAVWENKRAKAKEKPVTAKAPSWLTLNKDTATFKVDRRKAAVVKRIYKMTLKGVGQNALAQTLNREQVPVFGAGKHWHRSYIVKLLENPAVVGRFVPHMNEYKDGKLTRVAQESIEGYYPAIISQEAFDQVQTLRSTSRAPLRGRHAGNTLRNIFGSLARCPLCDSTMTLVNKGKGNGKPYLVCSRAKSGAGCKYRAVPYGTLEDAFLRATHAAAPGKVSAFVGSMPTGGDAGGAVDKEIENIQNNIDATEGYLGELLDTIAHTKGSPAVAQRIRETETELERMKAELETLYTKANALTSEMVARRVEQLVDTLGSPAEAPSDDAEGFPAVPSEGPPHKVVLATDSFDRGAVNALLRQLLTGVVVDYTQGCMVFKWRHGGENEVVFGMPEEESQEEK